MQKSIKKKGLVDSNQCTSTVNNGLGELICLLNAMLQSTVINHLKE